VNPSVSIIIPCKETDNYVRECVSQCKRLDFDNYEIIVLPDSETDKRDGIKIISTGPVTPSAKRNIGVAASEGELCAFIDSDAYPREDWLRSAVKYFKDPQVAAVGGPGLTPKGENSMQKASGHVLSSFMVGDLSSRYKAQRSFESEDIHSCNFIVRRAVLGEVGGWNEKYWPGEDTLICLAIRKLGKKLIEASDVVVYHHRRPLLLAHLKQVSRFGLHRGFFAKRFPENSLRLTYFFPSLLLLSFLAFAFASLFNSFFLNLLLVASFTYLGASLIAAVLEVRGTRLLFSVWLGIVATHAVYGVSFLVGLMKRDLAR